MGTIVTSPFRAGLRWSGVPFDKYVDRHTFHLDVLARQFLSHPLLTEVRHGSNPNAAGDHVAFGDV